MKPARVAACCTLMTLVLAAQPFRAAIAAATTDPPKATNADITNWMTELS